MIPRAKEDARDPRGFQAIEERLVVRDDDGPMFRREVEKRVISGTVAFNRPVMRCEALRRLGVPVAFREQSQLRSDRRGNRDVDVPKDATQLGVEMNLELEGHEEGVRVE